MNGYIMFSILYICGALVGCLNTGGSSSNLNSVPSKYCGGSGVQVDPYVLCNSAQFYEAAKEFDGYTAEEGAITKYFTLESDVKLDGSYQPPVFSKINFDGKGHVIIIKSDSGFDGIFGFSLSSDSQVSNLVVEAEVTTSASTFGTIVKNNSGVIENCTVHTTIKMTNTDSVWVGGFVQRNSQGGKIKNSSFVSDISLMHGYVGGVAGVNELNGEIQNVWGSTAITVSSGIIGGLVGLNSGAIDNSGTYINGDKSTTSQINSSYVGSSVTYMGGLVGWNLGSVTNAKVNTNVITSSFEVGGAIGNNSSTGIISNTISIGDVTGLSYVGGLVGWNSGKIEISAAHGNINAIDFSAGGLVGNSSTSSVIKDSFSTGNVSGKSSLGGFVGSHDNVTAGSITNCYSTGLITKIGNVNPSVGGFCGDGQSAAIVNSYWDTQSSGQDLSCGGIGKTTIQMKTQSTFPTWNFLSIWKMPSNDYPGFR